MLKKLANPLCRPVFPKSSCNFIIALSKKKEGILKKNLWKLQWTEENIENHDLREKKENTQWKKWVLASMPIGEISTAIGIICFTCKLKNQ